MTRKLAPVLTAATFLVGIYGSEAMFQTSPSTQPNATSPNTGNTPAQQGTAPNADTPASPNNSNSASDPTNSTGTPKRPIGAAGKTQTIQDCVPTDTNCPPQSRDNLTKPNTPATRR